MGTGNAIDAVTVELLVDDRPQEQTRTPSLLLKTLGRTVLTIITAGLFSHEPRCEVRILDRSTGAVLLRHDWDHNPDGAWRDRESIVSAAKRLTMAEFAAEYGIEANPAE
jgi:hypothetical protein